MTLLEFCFFGLKTSFSSSLKTSSSCSNCSEESDEVDCSVGEDGQVFSKLVDIILDCNQLSSNTAIVNCHQTQHEKLLKTVIGGD